MTDLLLPSVPVARVSPRLMDATARFVSPLTGTVRTVSRPGDRWGMRLDFQSLFGQDRARLESFIANLRGAANRAIYSPSDYVMRGSFPAPELVTNGTFASGSSGWGTSGASLVVADYLARVQNTGAAAGYAVNSSAITVATTVAYVVRVFFLPGKVSSFAVNLGTTSGASNILASGLISGAGAYVAAFVPSATTLFVSLLCDTVTSGDFVHYALVSITRCARVNGASQTGSTLFLENLPASTNGLLLPGDWFEVNRELKRTTAPLNSDSSGNGYVNFAPPIRNTPNNLDPVIVNQPAGRFIASASQVGWATEPGFVSTGSLDLIEAA